MSAYGTPAYCVLLMGVTGNAISPGSLFEDCHDLLNIC